MPKSKKLSNNWEIKVTGNLGEFKQKGDVKLKPEDITDCLKAYFILPAMFFDKGDPRCPSPVAGGEITINIRHIKN
ncbi:hypothetical protein HYT92_01235 [Candidatus Pacearchaeota archaeon]|nr:hypothetical protein [Candidatus Pacearchaeota archaeon]